MPTYVITAPDGREYEVDAPDTASQEEVLNYAKQNYTKVSPSPTKTTPNDKPSFLGEVGRQLGLTARAGVTALTDIPAMLAEPIAAGVNAVAGKEVFPNQAQAIQDFMTRMGIPEPQGKLERAVQRGAAAVGGVAGQAKLAAASGKEMLQPLTKELTQQGAAAGASATAAQAVSDSLKEDNIEGLPNFAATLGAGLLAGGVGAKATRVLGPTALNLLSYVTKGKVPSQSIPVVSIDDVKREAGRLYSKVDDAGITIKPKPVLDTLSSIEDTLYNKANFNPDMDAHKPVGQLMDQLRGMVGTERLSFTKMEQLRQTANDLVRESKDPATRRLAKIVVEGIDSKISGLQPQDLISGKTEIEGTLKTVKEAREAWRRTAKATMLEDALNVAEARALDPKASEGELIRTQFKQIAANKDKMKMFSTDEQTAIRKIVSGNGSQTLLSLLARFNPERSQLMAGAQIAGALSNPVAAGAVAGTGFAADKALGVVQNKAARDTISSILTGSTKAPKSTTEANLRALVEGRSIPYPEKESKEKGKSKVGKKGDTIILDGIEFPADMFGKITGTDTPTLPASMFRNEAAMRRAMQ